MRRLFSTVAIAALLSGAITPLAGQLPDPSAAALGLAESHTAWARGFNAVAVNPGALAMPDGPRASGSFAAVRALGGLGPIGLGDLSAYEGRVLPAEIREGWLDRITRADGERGSAGGDLTYVAVQFGRVGFQVASSADVVANLGPGAAELVLFGNAGRTGEPADIALQRSSLDAAVTSTFALGYGHPVMRNRRRSVSVGATAKYTIGHLLISAFDLGGGVTAEPLSIGFDFPIVQSDRSLRLGAQNRGSGVGADLGLAWREGAFLGGLAIRNVVNTFSWNEEELIFRPGSIAVAEETRSTDFEARPYSEAPEQVRSRVRDLGYSRVIAAGVAYEPGPSLRLSADLRQRLGAGHAAELASHVAAGVEYRPLGWLPLRVGGAVTSEGHQISGGLGLHVGPAHLDIAGARRRTDLGSASLGMLTFSLHSD